VKPPRRRLTLARALGLENARLKRLPLAILRRKGKDAWKYKDKKK
jgi:hypothetical protein